MLSLRPKSLSHSFIHFHFFSQSLPAQSVPKLIRFLKFLFALEWFRTLMWHARSTRVWFVVIVPAMPGTNHTACLCLCEISSFLCEMSLAKIGRKMKVNQIVVISSSMPGTSYTACLCLCEMSSSHIFVKCRRFTPYAGYVSYSLCVFVKCRHFFEKCRHLTRYARYESYSLSVSLRNVVI